MIDRQSFIDSLDLWRNLILSSTEELNAIYLKSEQNNPWFIRQFLEESVAAIGQQFLDPQKCEDWLRAYPEVGRDKCVGLIMAGNVPLVGFHDLFCVLAAGHRAAIKLSDKDPFLLPFLIAKWVEVRPEVKNAITYVDKLDQIDSVIATGSNNSGRYFEYYFRLYPHVFRHNRNGVAVLNGNESLADIKSFAKDIFMYFGLGCRNVSKMYVPEGYDFQNWNEAIADWSFMSDHNKYRNNLDYNFAIYLVNSVPHMNLGHLILKEDESITSRIGCLHYSFYKDFAEVEQQLESRRKEIQCVVSAEKISNWDHISFGKTQSPGLDQYADAVDTMAFLTSLN